MNLKFRHHVCDPKPFHVVHFKLISFCVLVCAHATFCKSLICVPCCRSSLLIETEHNLVSFAQKIIIATENHLFVVG
jgi:hypothetical protein